MNSDQALLPSGSILFAIIGYSCADPESFARGGPTLTLFLFDEGKEDQNPLKGSHHRPASETPFQWRFAGVLMTAQH